MLSSKNTTGPVVIISKEIMYTFPFGYAYLAGYLKEKGESITVEFRPENKVEYSKFVRKIINMKPLLVGFGTIYPDLYAVRDLIKVFDDEGRQFPIVIGGQMVSPTPEFSVQVTGADYGVIGEGEIILHELVQALRSNVFPSHVKGLVIREGDATTLTGPGAFIDDMTKLPAIPYELFPSDRWLGIGKFYAGYAEYYLAPMYKYSDRIVPIHGGRGCPYTCNFCYHHSKPRYRPISYMMDEAEMLIKRFDANMIEFSDDLVIATPKRAGELVEGIRKLSRPMEYSISCRFNVLKNMDDHLLKELKSSGCRIMGLGLESGSQRILDLMHKKITTEEIVTGLRRLKDIGIIPITAFMVGQLSETKEDAEQSMQLLRALVRYDKYFVSNFTITTPFPGSELYDIAFEKGLLTTHMDFFKKYDPSRDMCGVSLNLSSMSDQEVTALRNELEKVYMQEKKNAAEPAIYKIEKKRTFYKNISYKIQEKLNRLPDSVLSRGIISLYDKLYDLIQVKLDRKRLALYAASDRNRGIGKQGASVRL
jgi:Fe-S oxidoreductase